MWDYVYFLVYLMQKNEIELNGEESYAYNSFINQRYEWIPNKR
jgi:hypothetical protein